MKALVCEMCGSQDLVKQDGMYVCRNCGTKYAPEEAKKLMVEVSGSVKIDNTGRIENLYELARRARNDKNYADAANYYQEISIEKPNDWEAHFYKVYCKAMTCKNSEIAFAASSIANCLPSTSRLLESSNLSAQEKKRAAEGIALDCLQGDLAMGNGVTALIGNEYTYETGKQASQSLLYLNDAIGDFILPYHTKVALQRYTYIAESYNAPASLRESALKKAKQIDPEYTPKSNKSSSGGCYVATAVYGSYDCPEVWTLRRYRDYTLAETWLGRLFIALYYAISPTLVKWFGKTQWFKNLWKPKLDRLVERLNREGVTDTPYQDKQW